MTRTQGSPRRLADLPLLVQLVDGPQERGLRRRPALGVRATPDAVHVLGREPRAPREALMMAPLVLAVAVVRDAQDHELGVDAFERSPRHERAREPQPAPEQPAVAGEGREEVGRLPGPGRPADGPRD